MIECRARPTRGPTRAQDVMKFRTESDGEKKNEWNYTWMNARDGYTKLHRVEIRLDLLCVTTSENRGQDGFAIPWQLFSSMGSLTTWHHRRRRRSQFTAFAKLNGELLANCVTAALFRSSVPETYIQLKAWNFCWCPIMRGSVCVCAFAANDCVLFN